MANKRGVSEPAGDIAALILLIMLSIIIYIVLIPPAEREALLGENDTSSNYTNYGNYGYEQTLLSSSPGEVHPFTKGTAKKEISPVSLFTNKEDAITNIATSLTVSKSLFSEETKQLSFSIENIKNLDSASLFFFIKEAKGEMFIELNGNTIFEGQITQDNVPLTLPTGILKANNILRIGAKGKWWNRFSLSEIYVKSSYTYENTLAKRTFEISSREKSNIEKASLEYYVNCMGNDQGILSIMFNRKLLSDDYVVCDAGKRTLEISTRDLSAGTNVLEFRTDKGNYEIQGLELNMEMGEKTFPAYNFEITNEIYKDVFSSCYLDCESGCGIQCEGNNECYKPCIDDCKNTCYNSNVVLELTFADNTKRKKASITINEFEININTQAPEYVRVISDYIRRGDNVVKIVPRSSFDILNLRVFVG
ncbi:hypothetical protein J4231_01700 [Candidatus Woesearchaeota archaeon]|nr:hypothetical protein [Candidatus Woesearchaeota archaeon]